MHFLMWAAGMAGAALSVGGSAYLVLALLRLRRGLPAQTEPDWTAPAAILVPCHGAPPRLAECLDTILSQDHPDHSVVFGLHAADDPAKPVIQAAIARALDRNPDLRTKIVVDGRRAGANPKNCNLANMVGHIDEDVLMMIDSDVLVAPDFLRKALSPLRDPAVGGVTCLYVGSPSKGIWSALGALFHNDWFAPSVLVDLAGRERELGACYGAAIAVTKSSLAAIGGFESPVMADAVAQDFVFGHELKRAGFKVALAPVPVATVVDEGSFEELLRHEQRWSRALRSVRPKEHALAVFMSPFVPSLVLLAASPLRALLPLVAIQLLLRQAVHLAARRAFPSMPGIQPWLVPIREAFSFLVWSGSFFGRKVRWGQVELKTGAGLRMDRTEGK